MTKTSNIKERGFTIVELLVVIVVIGILAAITIVSYVGITARANTTKALSNAQSVQNIAEIYNADLGYYPATTGAFTTGSTSAKLPAAITVLRGLDGNAGAFSVATMSDLLTSSTGTNSVTYACLTSCTNSTGGRITYWDFSTSARSTTVIYVGAATAAGNFVTPAS